MYISYASPIEDLYARFYGDMNAIARMLSHVNLLSFIYILQKSRKEGLDPSPVSVISQLNAPSVRRMTQACVHIL